MIDSNSTIQTWVGTPAIGPSPPDTLGAAIAIAAATTFYTHANLDSSILAELQQLKPEQVQERLRNTLGGLGVTDSHTLDLPSIAGEFTVQTLQYDEFIKPRP